MTNYQSTNCDAWNKRVALTEAQKRMLQMSEEDIKHGRLTSQEQLDEEDLKWLNSTEQNAPCQSDPEINSG
ncbi:MAG: hypothetical protein GC178_02820 [Flavobacteriales bacterium]|nr:hypothetical protein [Flavobacteriales bacterium]